MGYRGSAGLDLYDAAARPRAATQEAVWQIEDLGQPIQRYDLELLHANAAISFGNTSMYDCMRHHHTSVAAGDAIQSKPITLRPADTSSPRTAG